MSHNSSNLRDPLSDFSWKSEVSELLDWLGDKDSSTRAFCFDLVMSLAFAESTSNIAQGIEQCDRIGGNFNSHLSFINLCAPCFFSSDEWLF